MNSTHMILVLIAALLVGASYAFGKISTGLSFIMACAAIAIALFVVYPYVT